MDSSTTSEEKAEKKRQRQKERRQRKREKNRSLENQNFFAEEPSKPSHEAAKKIKVPTPVAEKATKDFHKAVEKIKVSSSEGSQVLWSKRQKKFIVLSDSPTPVIYTFKDVPEKLPKNHLGNLSIENSDNSSVLEASNKQSKQLDFDNFGSSLASKSSSEQSEKMDLQSLDDTLASETSNKQPEKVDLKNSDNSLAPEVSDKQSEEMDLEGFDDALSLSTSDIEVSSPTEEKLEACIARNRHRRAMSPPPRLAKYYVSNIKPQDTYAARRKAVRRLFSTGPQAA